MALLFRKAALDCLSAPEQLDRTLYVTTPKRWIALVALLATLNKGGFKQAAFGGFGMARRMGESSFTSA